MTTRRSRWCRWVAALMVGIGGEAAVTSPALAQVPGAGAQEVQTVVSARQTLDEFSRLAIESIPPAMLQAAEGVAIFPNMIKGGFILGVNYGRGVLCVRRPDRSWSAPVMVTMGGGSLGFQAGVQSADIMLVFATPRSLQGILSGQKVTLGADASIALGPIGPRAIEASAPSVTFWPLRMPCRLRGVAKTSMMSADCTPAWKPRLPPPMVTITGADQLRSGRRTHSTPRP